MQKLDLTRLSRDVACLRKSHPAGLGPGGRPATGAMAIVRENLGRLEALHAAGFSWVDIAVGLAAQNVLHGSGRPLTGRQLTGLIASVRRQQRRRETKATRRATRTDLSTVTSTLTLAAELSAPAQLPALSTIPTEADLRRERLASLGSLMKESER
ncbi:hypothetical protein DWF00_19950 [Bosea caraganae]|uniref:Uncharacterized protein n=1 Tax=Bosea caraganae TaxID=2763117 RepID=A0A370KZ49_9HYPH|nr:hypothetical protein [Bosea caraganae]RDJ20275.1 hypothetical protein DWE98_25240 [Bosea caraganae]RDJ23972.1 hypothetical protein DWF00_19950 [Bosea caraganae]